MSTNGDQQGDELAAERERQRQLNARVHKHMGMTAAILGLGAAAVALVRLPAAFGISAWEGLRIGATGLPWVLLVLGLGVLFSLGASRLMMLLTRWFERNQEG